MLVVVQFPIADARAFAPVPTARLDVPDWPSPRTYYPPQFVRRFGPAVDRRRGADAAWLDEKAFCEAGRAVRFPSLKPIPIGTDGRRMAQVCAFRRLLCDESTAVVRVELGIASSKPRSTYSQLEPAEAIATVQAILNQPSSVFDPAKGWVTAPLQIQGQRLAALYALASSQRKLQSRPTAGLRLVSHGRPIVILNVAPDELKAMPREATRVQPPPVTGVDLSFMYVSSAWGPLPLWILQHDGADPMARSLRLSLLRLHAEQEVLDLVLGHLKGKRLKLRPYTDSTDRLTSYLNDATRAVSETHWHGVERSAVLSAYGAATSVEPDDLAALAQRLTGMRGQIAAKIKVYAAGRGRARTVNYYFSGTGGVHVGDINVSVGGDNYGIVAGTLGEVNDSFKTFADSKPAPDVKSAVGDLKTQVDALLPKLSDPVATKKAGNAFKTLTQQAADPDPVEEIVTGAGKALVTIGQSVQDMAQPITAAVHAVFGALKIVAIL